MFDRKRDFCFISFFVFLLFLAAQASAVVIGPPPPTPTITITEIQSTYEEGENITIGGTSENLSVIEATLNLTSLQDIIAEADGSWTLDLGSSLAQGVYQLVLVSPGGEASAEADFEVVAPPPPPNLPPDCSEAYADKECLWPPNHQMIPINILGVTDPDGDPITITVTGATSDEATATDKGSGGSKHSPDAIIEGGAVKVRSERSGSGNGRVYEIGFAVSDGKMECQGKVRVNVPHDQSEEDCDAVNDGQYYNATKKN